MCCVTTAWDSLPLWIRSAFVALTVCAAEVRPPARSPALWSQGEGALDNSQLSTNLAAGQTETKCEERTETQLKKKYSRLRRGGAQKHTEQRT